MLVTLDWDIFKNVFFCVLQRKKSYTGFEVDMERSYHEWFHASD